MRFDPNANQDLADLNAVSKCMRYKLYVSAFKFIKDVSMVDRTDCPGSGNLTCTSLTTMWLFQSCMFLLTNTKQQMTISPVWFCIHVNLTRHSCLNLQQPPWASTPTDLSSIAMRPSLWTVQWAGTSVAGHWGETPPLGPFSHLRMAGVAKMAPPASIPAPSHRTTECSGASLTKAAGATSSASRWMVRHKSCLQNGKSLQVLKCTNLGDTEATPS